ncbi:hypothetical protein DRE_06679 [Drechslerella stenobrocha 248]|uniref:Peptidase S59 domain-containing protein n=1 Tax=Drechslerella stenobrocha 248 TaxID=1043628 RepID=W7HXF8_9PEZI|nr:hypothetical protein DRE_06679 [Drechslerella stenobrocha 248]
MFSGQSGGGGFGGFGQNQQQQQQQQPAGGFGSNTTGTGFGGFGASNAGGFGQNKGFGSTPATTAGGLFGSNTATSGFGAGASGAGGFGSNNTTTGGTGFGASTAGGGLFGSKPASTGFGAAGAGTGTGMFGNSTTTGTTGFGGAQTAGGFGATGNTSLQIPAQGTATSVFNPFTEKDAASSMTNHFQTISFQEPYTKWSLEELRLQDYTQSRTKAAGPTGFGSAAAGFGAFGQQQQQQTTGGFGQPQTTSTVGGGLFGTASNTATTGFGTGTTGGFGASTNTNGGLFGSTKPAGTGIFGNSTTATGNAASTGTGLFGQQNAGTGFGAAANTATPSGFGQQPAQSTGTGLFGAQNQQKPGGFGAGGFGTAAATTTGGFGQPSSSLFGQPAASTATGTGGLFGAGATQQPASGFGQPATNAFGGGFGAQNQAQPQAANTGFGGAFGQNTAQTPSKPAFGGGFGAPSTTPAPNPSGGGLFGQPAQTQQAGGGGLFGNKGFTSNPTTGTNLFGQPAQQPAQSGGLFGQPAATTGAAGLFGQPQQQQQQQQQPGGLFGSQQAKPAGSGLFGQPAQTNIAGGGLFGSASTNNQAQGSTMFGQPTQNTGTGFGLGQPSGTLFGSNPQTAQAGFGGSLFQQQQMMQQSGMQQPLTASIMDQRPYGNVPLLDISLSAAAAPNLLATPLSGSTKKKAAMIPHSKIAPRQPALAARVASPFSRSSLGTSSPMLGGSLGRTFNGSSSRVGLGGSVFDSPSASDDSILNTSAFTPGGNRTANLKRLVIDRNLRDHDLFVKEGEARAIKGAQDSSPTPETTTKKTVSFDANTRSQTSSPSSGADLGYMRTPTRQSAAATVSPVPAPENALVAVADSPEPQTKQAAAEMEDLAAPSPRFSTADEKKGDYWSIPSVEKLKSLPREKLSSVPDLLVGRTNFGQIRFDHPVDLTAIAEKLDALLGGVITFGDRVCTVYPPGWDKPSPGNGLNMPATITLEECFPTDREHKQPIRDPDHPRYQFHLRRLKSIKDTEFVDYLVQDGIWIFKVKHFTTYGLPNEDDESTDADMEDSIYTDATPTRSHNVSDSMYSEATPTQGHYASDSIYSEATPTRGQYTSSVLDSSFASAADITFEDDSIADDTFEFKRSKKAPAMRFIADPESSDMLEPEDESEESVGNSDLSEEEDTTQILPHDDVSILGEEDEDTELATVTQDYREATPEVKLGVGRDWTDQLSRTISPVKNRVPIGFKASVTSSRNPFTDVSNVDFSENLFASRNRDFESPYRPSVRTFAASVIKPNKKATSGYQRPKAFDQDGQQPDDREWRQCIRPSWGPNSELVYVGTIEGGRSRGFGDIKTSKTKKAKLKYSASSASSAINLLGFQLAASEITQDQANIPLAKLDRSLEFSQFAKAKFGASPQQQYEKGVWQLASILFDPLEDKLPETVPFHVKLHIRDKKRKSKLSHFFEQIVAQDVAKAEKAAPSIEASAVALLSGHKVEEAVMHLISGNDFRLATLVPLIGGDKQARDDLKKQLQSWRSSGVLAEVPLPIRALYELVSGNVGYSEGISAPMEDATPSFWFGQMFGLDWRRTFALRLWYEIFEDEKLEQAVARYESAFRATETQNVRHPEPWYTSQTASATDDQVAREGESPIYDTLWGLLKIYTDDNYQLEKVLLPRSYSPSPCDFRLAWQMRMMFAEKQIRDLAEEGGSMTDEGESFVAADRLTTDFAGQLEAEGEWQWAVFVLMHLGSPASRAHTIKDMLARHVADLGAGNDKLEFVLHRLLIPSAWVYEAKALQARFQQDHFEEVDCLLSASAWNEAHKTLLAHAAPLCIINEDLDKLYGVICKFTDATVVSNWGTGAQVYLDFITLTSLVQHAGHGYAPATPKIRGLQQANSRRDVARRLVEALPKMDVGEFLPGVAVREMSRVLADYILNSRELAGETSKVLGLPLTEDQMLYKELTIKAREGVVY